MGNEDILKVIPTEDVSRLRDMYEKHLPYTYYVNCLLDICIEWMRKDETRRDLMFLAPNGDWKTNGTFVLVMQLGCHQLYVFTLEKCCRTLRAALSETRMINWSKGTTIFAVLKEHMPVTLRVLSERRISPVVLEHTLIWQISVEEALRLDTTCPEDVYVDKLDASHATLIDSVWPHKFDGTEKYIATLLQMNCGYGVFLRSNGELAAWILKTQLGCMGNLQTLERHKRKGYGALVTAFLSKKIAEEGCKPWATVLDGNKASERLFGNLGFRVVQPCTFVVID